MNDRYLDILISKAIKLREDGNSAAALEQFKELADQVQNDPRIHYHLGMLCMDLKDNYAACGHLRELVRLQPDFLEGRMLLGMALAELGKHDEAIEWLRGVLDECPGVAEIHHRIGLCLADLHKFGDAFNEYQEVLRLAPGHVGAFCGLGILYTSTGQIGEAKKTLLRALELDPKSVNAINNLGRIFKIWQAGEALQWFQRGLDIEPENPALVSNYLFTLNCVPGLTAEFIAEKYREYAPRAFHPPEGWQQRKLESRQPGSPIRIGYVSADFYGHSVAFFLEPVMERHDRRHFEIYCYSNGNVSDETTERLKKYCRGWRCVVGMSDRQVADMIADDRIDVLVDLSGHTSGHRLDVFVLRPAPVQVSWIGHPNTTGLPQVDYYLTDAWCDPPGMTEQFYCEKLYRLPGIFSCYQPPEEFPVVTPLHSLLKKSIVFGCFNNMTKINQELISWWSRILRAVPGSQMFIKGPALDDAGIRTELLACFDFGGIPPERIILQGITDTRLGHLELYNGVDIALDTFPYHGTTTTCEAFWMGVPVVTLAGSTHVSRVGVSLLHSVGLDDLIAGTPEEYIDKAVNLANNRRRLVDLRENLRMMLACSPLMDAAGVTREVEEAYMTMLYNKESEAQ